MIEIKVDIPADFMDEEIKRCEAQCVLVGFGANVGVPDFKTRKPDGKKTASGLPNGISGGAGLIRRAIKRGKYGEIRTVELAGYLDKRYKFLSHPKEAANSQWIREMADEFAKALDPDNKIQERRLENAGIALIRQPVLDKMYGSNSADTIKAKGFDHPLIDTGNTMSWLNAKYYAEGENV